MPTFRFDKLVRDKFPEIYAALGQTIVTRTLTTAERRIALRDKIIEEANELPLGVDADKEVVAGELADMQQIIDDLCAELGITRAEVAEYQSKKAAKKGGFSAGLFVETITLADDDEWVSYYRAEPDKYPEIKEEK